MTSGEETTQAIGIIGFLVLIGLPVAFVIGLIAFHLITGCAEIAKFFWWDTPKAFVRWLARPPESRASAKMQPPAPKYHAHGPDGNIIGTFDTILDAEVCGLTADGVKAVDLPLVLHERRRLGTYGSLRDSEPEPKPVLTPHWRCNTCGNEGPGYGSQSCQRCNSMFIEHL